MRTPNFDSYYDPPDYPEFCSICLLGVDDCICPECVECGTYGDPKCYLEHGLEVSDEQIESNRKLTEEWQKQNEEEHKFWEQYCEKYDNLLEE